MIKLFVSDIDGCLAEPYAPYALDQMQTLAAWVRAGGDPEAEAYVPAFSLCSGRAYAYVEAMSQLLGVRTPVLFESGGGLFDPVAARLTWSPAFTDTVADATDAVRRWMHDACLPGTSLSLDYGKRTQAGLVGPDYAEVAAAVPRVEAEVAARYPALRVFHTPFSIDVVARDITKRHALQWLAEVAGVALGEMAYIGDSNGDLPALAVVGTSFAPANAAEVVRAQVQHVTAGSLTAGVVEAFQWCLDDNRAQLARAS